MTDEGYIKYRCDWVKTAAVSPQAVVSLTPYRDALFQLNFIGQRPDGIGFGNISQRVTSVTSPLRDSKTAYITSDQFIISGTQTGNLTTLAAADYALVTDFSSEQNSLTCQGLRKASSESLTHGVIYSSHPTIGAIIHVHHAQLWQQLLHQVPTTRESVRYGTPEMAKETQWLFEESSLMQHKIFAMAGHEDGVVTFGDNLQTAYRTLINWSIMTGVMSQKVSNVALQMPYQLMA